ncbi:hypothetical protein [Streptomyces sp. NPDC056817]|uniref:hypothetical protein n=1 Tax=Streptomyces sp. NPDC056817 TaxID=3345950 RepID=UPI0036BD53D6
MVRSAAGSVRYRKGGPNTVLRLALWEIWGSKCYWCNTPVLLNSTQIDHIVPQNVSEARLEELKSAYRLPIDFDLHDPRNLAPICTSCNGVEGKGNTTHVAPVVMTRLKYAEKRRSAVIARVLKFGRSGKVAEHLLQAAMADLSDPDIRQEFVEHAPAVVQTLAMTDPELGDYLSFHLVEVAVQSEAGDYQRVQVTLDSRGRTAVALLEKVCGSALDDVLQGPVIQLVEEISGRVTDGFEALESAEPITVGEPTSDFVTINVDSLDFRRFAGTVEFTFGGDFEASLSASLVRVRPDGDGTDDLQGDAVVSGSFSIDAVWELADDQTGVTAGDCIIDAWTQDLHAAR